MIQDTFKTLSKRGNLKIGKDTLIFNMGSAGDCPSLKNGQCKVARRCYALKDEKIYPDCKSYRERQANYWLSTPAKQIIKEMDETIDRMHVKPKYFRFNESGDFYSQHDVRKLSAITEYLKKRFGIITYGFTARKDLDFDKAAFLVKGSSHDNANNGITITRHVDIIKTNSHTNRLYTEKVNGQSRHFSICPMNCRSCTHCKTGNGLNVVFPLLQERKNKKTDKN